MIIKKTTNKPWYTSKILWTGAAMIGSAIAQSFIDGLNWKASLLAGFGALVVFLRTITTKELTK